MKKAKKKPPKKTMKWLKNHKGTIAMLIASVVVSIVGVVFIAIDWENNKMTLAALSPILMMYIAAFVAVLARKKSL